MQIIFVPPIGEHLHFTHIPIFVCAIMVIDVYTRHRFSQSLGSLLSGPGQKALQAMNEFTLFVDFGLIPLSKTCALDVPANNL